MSGDETERARPLRSARWFRKDDLPGFVHRTTLAAAGWSREDLMSRPVIGILNTWSDINPCNGAGIRRKRNIRQLPGKRIAKDRAAARIGIE